MDLTAYLRIFRQRWPLVLLPCLAAVIVAAVTLPPQDVQRGPVVTTYQATATLIASPTTQVNTVPLSLATVALFATRGEIPERAADLLDYPGEPQVLASQMTVTAANDTGTLDITASGPDGDEVADTVNKFAQATMEYFRDEEIERNRLRLRQLNRQLNKTETQLAELRALQGDGDDPVLETRIENMQAQFSVQLNEKFALNRSTGGSELLTFLQRAVPIPQATQTFVAPSNPAVRFGIAGLLGLLLGAALALLVERLDSRMRTREQVERGLGIPVLAEIPLQPRKRRDEVASAVRPASDVAEAFRALRSSVLLMRPGRSNGSAKPPARASSVTLIVTSALPGEGKTTTVANLAATMAEAGRRVLVLSLDLRNPRVHDMLGATNGPGVSDLLADPGARQLRDVVQDTTIPGVTIATSGEHLEHPGALLASVGPVVAAARSMADVVLIDTPPMLAVSDALDVARHTDGTLLVSRLNRTTRPQAEECRRRLDQLGLSALGTVLIGSRPAGARYGYPMPTTGTTDQVEASPASGDSSSG